MPIPLPRSPGNRARLHTGLLRVLLPLCLALASWGARAGDGHERLLLVLHAQGHQVTLLGSTSATVHATRTLPVALAGAPQPGAQAPHVDWASEDGQIVRLALPSLQTIAQVPAGVGPGAPLLARSGDGRWLLAAGTQAALAQVWDDRLQPVRRIPIGTLDGRTHSDAAQLLDLPWRQSWLLAPRTLNELWEISYDPQAAPIFDGLVHDYRMGEALPTSGFLGVRRTPLPAPLAHLLAPAPYPMVLGAHACTPPTPCTVRLLHLDTRSTMAQWRLAGTPRPDDSAVWERAQQPVLALAGTDTPAALIALPRTALPDAPHLPAPALRLQAPTAGGALWLQRSSGAWSQLDPHTLEEGHSLQASTDTRLLPLPTVLVLATPGASGMLRLHDPQTLAERQRVPLDGLRGVWAVAVPQGDVTDGSPLPRAATGPSRTTATP